MKSLLKSLFLCFFCASNLLFTAEDTHPAKDKSLFIKKGKKNLQGTDCTIMGFYIPNDGLGQQAIDLIKTLRNKTRLSYLPLPGCSRKPYPNKKIEKILYRSGRKSPGKVLIAEMGLGPNPPFPQNFWKATRLTKHNEQIRYAYAMFESSKISPSWVDFLNQNFDGILVPDVYVEPMFTKSGVRIPVFVVPLGRDLEIFLKKPLKSQKNTPFVFANYGTCLPRKNQYKLVEAFIEAFGNTQDVQLHLSWTMQDNTEASLIKDLIAKNNMQNIKIHEGGVPLEEYVDRFSKIDCYVSISTGEGFSNQPREAMALGIPTIVSDAFAQKTICDSGFVRVVPAHIPIPAKYSFPGEYGIQYQCTTQDVVSALKDVYENYDSFLQKGSLARAWASQYTLENTAAAYLSVINPRHVLRGKTNMLHQGGIITPSKKLLKKYEKILRAKKKPRIKE